MSTLLPIVALPVAPVALDGNFDAIAAILLVVLAAGVGWFLWRR